jgi:hypothetical protein
MNMTAPAGHLGESAADPHASTLCDPTAQSIRHAKVEHHLDSEASADA